MRRAGTVDARLVVVTVICASGGLTLAEGGAAASFESAVALPRTVRVSVTSHEAESRAASRELDISANGRYVAFTSSAAGLVRGDTNQRADVFVRDRATGVTRRVSLTTGGQQANGPSFDPAISADGRHVAFVSAAGNLVAGDSNGTNDVFVRDLANKVTRRVSIRSDGAQAYRHGSSFQPAISADGQYVAFTSVAPNLVPGDTNYSADVFVRDRVQKVTERVSVGTGGVQAIGGNDPYSSVPAISSDGCDVAFESHATDLFPNDNNQSSDVFVRHRCEDLTERVSVALGGSDADSWSNDPDISADGQFVGFQSSASNLVMLDENDVADVFVRDLATQQTERVSIASDQSEADAASAEVAVSADGRYIAFESHATNLVESDLNHVRDVFIRDRLAGLTERVSVAREGAEANGRSIQPAVSAHGRYVAFMSKASNLIRRDTNGVNDVFVRVRGAG